MIDASKKMLFIVGVLTNSFKLLSGYQTASLFLVAICVGEKGDLNSSTKWQTTCNKQL